MMGRLFVLWLVLLGRYAFALDEGSCEANQAGSDGTCADETLVDDEMVKHGRLQVEWINSAEGGYVNQKYEIRREVRNDPTSRLGVFAKEDIEEGEILLTIPRTHLLSTPNGEACDTTQMLVEEIEKGDDSHFAPYINYLKTQMYAQLPGMWSSVGRTLLQQLVGATATKNNETGELEIVDGSYASLPPEEVANLGWIVCPTVDEEKYELELYAAMLVTQRGWDEVLIPVMDMLSHRNGKKWYNTDSNSVHDQESPVNLWASKSIKEGDEIYTSYDMCTDCGGRKRGYGTPEIFRDYGFVEMFPQRWTFPTILGMSFGLDYEYNDQGESNGNLKLKWLRKPWSDDEALEAVELFESELKRLRDEVDVSSNSPFVSAIPKSEWDTIVIFHSALVTAMTKCVETIRDETPCLRGEGTCRINPKRYDPLNKPSIDTAEVTRPYSCDTEVSMDFDDYDVIENIKSIYQSIGFFQHPETKDMCFDLDDVYQQCTSYRPQYHEMVTHYTARFLPDVRRVLFVGGGDSMLLHEALQYPNLEFVIGLELDQKVTRSSFQYFGTQPQWDNEKVQWWFGDGAKSLLMLPEHYFGTFDMVLVDLSETVMSGKVTKGLDILGALSLLLKEDGIFVKNELYLDQMSEIFKFSLQISYPDVSVICSQCLILGSNSIDFIHTDPTNHGVKTRVTPLEHIKDHYNVIHSYTKNHNPTTLCMNDEGAAAESDSDFQESSPGILLILEAEAVSGDLSSAEKIKESIAPALASAGLTVATTLPFDGKEGQSTVISILEEGYVVARCLVEEKYCALDVHLWSAFSKLEDTKKALLKALGSEIKGSSSFRVVAGGMFGVSTWREDEKSRGPQNLKQHCENISNGVDEKKTVVKPTVEDKGEAMNVMLSESLNFVEEDGAVALIVCAEESVPCESIRILSNHKSIRNTIPLRTCAELAGNSDTRILTNQKYECEQHLMSMLRERVNADDARRVGTIVLDPTASKEMAQILLKVVGKDKKVPKKRATMIHKIPMHKNNAGSQLFAEDLFVLAPILNPEEAEWRTLFAEKFRSLILKEPSFMSDISFNDDTTVGHLALTTFRSGDEKFIDHAKEFARNVEKRTGLPSDIRSIEGGLPTYQDNFVSNQTFTAEAYDTTESYEQWMSQTPWGHQTILQLEISESSEPLSSQIVREMVDHAIASTEDEHPLLLPPQEFTTLGDGSVTVVAWSDLTSVVVLWDGRRHVGINVFTVDEDHVFPTEFADAFKAKQNTLDIALRDDIPRGWGRVVNFMSNIATRPTPYWAEHVLNS